MMKKSNFAHARKVLKLLEKSKSTRTIIVVGMDSDGLMKGFRSGDANDFIVVGTLLTFQGSEMITNKMNVRNPDDKKAWDL